MAISPQPRSLVLHQQKLKYAHLYNVCAAVTAASRAVAVAAQRIVIIIVIVVRVVRQ